MNHIFNLLSLTKISSPFIIIVFLFSRPCNASERPIIFNININQNIIIPSLLPEVRDTNGNPLERDRSYLILLSNTIKGGQPANNSAMAMGMGMGIGLFSFNQTCPFHVALSLTALPLKINPSPSISVIYKGFLVNFHFDYYPAGQDCPESKTWQVSNSRGYVKTGEIERNNYYESGFRIFEAGNQNYVYKLQYCFSFSVDCEDVNVVTLEPNVMVLVVNDDNDGVPLHVKFQKV